MTISKLSKIKENTKIFIVKGRWSAYVIRDCLTKELVLYMPYPHYKGGTKTIRHSTKKIDQDATYEDIFPSKGYTITIQNIEPLNLKLNKPPHWFIDIIT